MNLRNNGQTCNPKNPVEAQQSFTLSDARNDVVSLPLSWPYRRKWAITGFACLMSFFIGINALSISSVADVLNQRFGVSDRSFPNSYLTITSWNIGAVIGPVIGLPLMESIGVRTAYLVSYAFFIVFVVPQAVAQNFATLIVTRFFAGGFGGVLQNAVANVIGDIWTKEESTIPVILFIYAYLMGFSLGPPIASAIAQPLGWRWIFYMQLIFYVPLFPLALIFLRETRASVLGATDTMETSRPSFLSLLSLLYESTVRPIYLFFTEPVLFFFTLWSGLAVGNVFLASQSIAQIYGQNYNFTILQSGYVESAFAVGETIGVLVCLAQARIYRASAAKNPRRAGIPVPESRLELSIPTSILCFAGGLFVYAWTSFPSVPWIAPTVGLGLVGVSTQVVVLSAVVYITDAYGVYSGSAIAAVASVENLFSGLLPLASKRMYTVLGFQWASSLLAFFALALSAAPVVLYLMGPRIRAKSKFMLGD